MLLTVGGSLVAAEPATAAAPVVDQFQTPHFHGGSALVGDAQEFQSGTWSGSPTSYVITIYTCPASNTAIGSCSQVSTQTITSAGSVYYTPSSSDAGKYLAAVLAVTNVDGVTISSPYRENNVLVQPKVVTLSGNGGTLGTVTTLSGLSVTLPTSGMSQVATLPTRSGCSFSGWSSTTSPAQLINQPNYSPMNDITLYAIWAGANCASVSLTPSTPTTSTTPTVISESAKPLPVWAAPILKQIPTLSKTLTTDGGKLSLTDGDFSSLKSVTIGGAPVAFSIDAKGDVNIPVPAGKGGTTADLIVTFTGGKMTIQDGIKYVEPVNVAAVREAPITGFKGKSTKFTGALADSIQYAAQLDKKATTVLCTGYATSKAVLALATARAEAACAYATKVNDLLVNKTVKVVVNAKLAKTAAVGIKVYKATN